MIPVLDHLAAFTVVAILVIVTPGPDTALTVRNALRGGRRGGVLTASGVATGQTIWALAASSGLAAALSASSPAFLALRLAGAGYLIYLGLSSLRRATRGSVWDGKPVAAVDPGKLGSAYRQGLISNLGNPKMAVFFISLLPQFAGHSNTSLLAMLGLGTVFAAMTLIWLSAYAAVVAQLGDALRRTPVRRVLDAATGAILIGLGVHLATD